MKTLSFLAVFVVCFSTFPSYADEITVDFVLAKDEAVIIRQAGVPLYSIDGCQQPTQVVSLSYDDTSNSIASLVGIRNIGVGTEFGFPLRKTTDFVVSFMPNNEEDDIVALSFTVEAKASTIVTFSIEKYITDSATGCFLKRMSESNSF